MLEFLFGIIGLGIVIVVFLLLPIKLTLRTKLFYSLLSFGISMLSLLSYRVFGNVWPVISIISLLSIILGLLIDSYNEKGNVQHSVDDYGVSKDEQSDFLIKRNIELDEKQSNHQGDIDFLSSRIEEQHDDDNIKDIDFEKLLSHEPVIKGE